MSNWFVRASTATALQAAPDASGNTLEVERRSNSVAGEVANYNLGSSPLRDSDLHFNGTAWTVCGLNSADVNGTANATGAFTSNTCNNRYITQVQRVNTDIGGRTFASVITDVRAAGNFNLSIGNNSPAALASALGSGVFPPGSVLFNQTNTAVSNAIIYYPGTSNLATQYSAAITAGGVAANQAAGTGCNSAEFNTDGSRSTTLESLISANSGTPCVFAPVASFTYTNAGVTNTFTNPDSVNEAWGGTSLGIGRLGNNAVGTGVAPGYYSGNTRFRIAFKGTGTNPVTYYACKERFNTGSSRNCEAIGTGSYTITTRGDGRTLSLNNPPAQLNTLTSSTVLVERNGGIYYGAQDKLGTSTSARLNLTAANSLLAQLGLPVINPDVPLALSKTSYAGNWAFTAAGSPQETTQLRLNSNGPSSCVETDNRVSPAVVTTNACVITFTNLATGAFTLTRPGRTGSYTGVLGFLTGNVTGTYSEPTAVPPISAAITGARQ